MHPVERLVAALRQHGQHPKPSTKGWTCRCPAHSDKAPSLSIGEGDDRRALVYCHAGCTPEQVCEAVGLRLSDLFLEADAGQWRPPRTSGTVTVTETPATDSARGGFSDSDAPSFPRAEEAIAHLEHRHGPRSAEWTYTNTEGEPVGFVIRWNLPPDTPDEKPRKRVLPVSLVDGRWQNRGMPEPRPLYELPDLLAAAPSTPVYIVEGEKAADAAQSLGLTATTSPHGSQSASKADWSPLSGREVRILPDHDQAGEEYAEAVTGLALTAGARSVRIVRLADAWSDMPESGDIADLLEHHGGDPEAVRAEVEHLAVRCEPETAPTAASIGRQYLPFPVTALPHPISTFVAEAAEAIGCDPSSVALPLLSALASAIGTTRSIQLKRGWAEPPIIWTAIVAESGAKKSPPLARALQPIRRRQRRAMKDHAAAMEDYETATAIHERDTAEWKRSASSLPPPVKPQRPVPTRYVVDDVTTEAIAVLLQENPRGLLMTRDELSGWFNFDRYVGGKGGDAAKWLEMHCGRALVVDRKGSGNIHVPRAAVSITGSIQPEILRRVLTAEHRSNGLAARILFCLPPRIVPRWSEAEVSERADAEVDAVFSRLYSLEPDCDDDGDACPRQVPLSPKGKEEWIRFYNEHAEEQAALSGDEAAAWSKLECYAARLALVIHFVRWAAADPNLDDSDTVDEWSMAAGVDLARWFGHESQRIYDVLNESKDEADLRRWSEWIKSRGGIVTANDLAHGLREFRGRSAMAAQALERLAHRGLGCFEHEPSSEKGGRPTKRFRLHDGLSGEGTT